MITVNCGSCGVIFAMSRSHQAGLMRDGGTFYCLNGHARVYSETVADKLKKAQAELESKNRLLTAAKCEATNERNLREAKERELKRHKIRVQNGVCPCCNRAQP